MKKSRFSIKIRVTLWYTFMVTSLALLMLYALVAGVSRAADLYHEDLLTHAMADASEQVRYVGAIPQLDSSAITDFDKVSFALFNAEGGLWRGHWPFFEAPFSDGEIRQAEAADRVWLFQDLLLPFAQGDLWLRGYLALDSMHFLRREALSWFWFLLPCLILFAAIGGYLLTRRAFRRIVQMAKQADEQRLAGISEAEAAGSMSAAEAAEFAKQAVIQEYDLNAQQQRKLICEEGSTNAAFDGEQPLLNLLFWLWQNEDGTFTEKDGQYWVTINLITGVIEDILYDAGLAGNG